MTLRINNPPLISPLFDKDKKSVIDTSVWVLWLLQLAKSINDIETGGSGGNAWLQDALDSKQDALIAGDNITITGNTISATAGSQSGSGMTISATEPSNPTINSVWIETGGN